MTMITPSYLGETIEYSSLHACRSTLEDPTGLSPGEARSAALREFGGVEQVKEAYRDQRGLPLVDALAQDLRYGLRQLRKSPGFAVASVTSIALGISATTAVFSFIYPLLIKPFPYRDANRMFWLVGVDNAGPVGPVQLSRTEFLDLQKVDVLDGAIATAASPMTVVGHDLSDAVTGERLSANAFSYFGVPPLLGRTFTSDDSLRSQDSVAVLSHRFWQRALGGSPNALGTSLRLDDQEYKVIGILPERFRGVFNNAELYVPLRASPNPNVRSVIQVRLKAGVTKDAAEAALLPLFTDLAKAAPNRYSTDFRVHLMGLNEAAGDRYTGTLVPVFVASTLLLVVGCLNVSMLFLARGAARQPELAIRRAIGAGRGRLIGQLITESLLLAFVGGAFGVLLAKWAVRAIVALLLLYVPPDTVVELNTPVLLFSTMATVLAALAFGVSPAFRLSRPRLSPFLMGNSRSVRAIQGRRLYPVLIAGQVALTMVLLAAAGAAVRTFLQLYHVELGYNPKNVLRLTLLVPRGRYTTWPEREHFSDSVRAQIAQTAGVESVTVGQVPPVAGGRNRVAFADRAPAADQFSFVQRVSHEYLSTLKIRVVRGRMWSEDDDAHATPLVVINQAMARRYWPGTDPIGQRIRLPDFKSAASWARPVQETTGWLEIVGVAADTPNTGLRDPASPSMYIPNSLMFTAYEYLVIRTHGDPSRTLPVIRNQLRIVDTSAVLASIGGVSDGSNTADDVLRDIGWGRERLIASLFVSFGCLALTLAAVGLYGVVSYVVTHRQGELAIRMALGAQRASVVRMVLASTILAVTGGLTLGLVLTLMTGRVLAQWAGVATPELFVLVSAAIVLLAMAALAAAVPARRAATIDPMVALRCE